MIDPLMCVTSDFLDSMSSITGPNPVELRNGVRVNGTQFEKAATLLRATDPSICNGVRHERPAYIDKDRQESDDILVFEIGMLPSKTYHIDREGNLVI